MDHMKFKNVALVAALRDEITTRDNTHAQLEIIDMIVHELLKMTEPKHTANEDCGCAKEIVHE